MNKLPQISESLPTRLADVALIDAAACAAVGSMSVSWWLAKVAAGSAPKPAFRAPRCTRWRAIDVMAFWDQFAKQGDTEASARLMAQAHRAAAAAQKKRAGVDK